MADVVGKTTLVVKKEDRNYILECPPNGNLGEVFDALTEMRSWTFERIKQVEENDKALAKQQEEAKQTSSKVENIDG